MATDAAAARRLAATVRDACIEAALQGYERAQIAGLCPEGAWEAAVDAMRRLDLNPLPRDPLADPPPAGPPAA